SVEVRKFVPHAGAMVNNRPAPVSFSHVPVVSPGNVTVLYSHAAAPTLTACTQERLVAPLRSDTPKTPATVAKIQKHTVTDRACVLPNISDATRLPSMGCTIVIASVAATDPAVATDKDRLFLKL